MATDSRDRQLRFRAAANGDEDAARRHLKIVLRAHPGYSAYLLPEVKSLTRKLGLDMPAVPRTP